jgi:hypothetical protein
MKDFETRRRLTFVILGGASPRAESKNPATF